MKNNSPRYAIVKELHKGLVKDSIINFTGVVYMFGDNMCYTCFEKDLEIFMDLKKAKHILFFAFSDNKRSIKEIISNYSYLKNKNIINVKSINNVTFPLIIEMKNGKIIKWVDVINCNRSELKMFLIRKLENVK